LAKSEGYGEIKGLKSLAMLEVCHQIAKVARTDSAVLILGETGTGKELIARELHRKSTRADQAFVILNCAALPNEGLMISELFGHVRGAFTGADKDKEGYFETADSGTIFLDEIGKSSLNFQSKLLRVLESGEFNRLGETAIPRKTDVRIISAAGPNLMEQMQKGEFYPDLYYRLESFVIRVPPLRERREDIGEIAEYFLRKFAATYHKDASSLSAEALELLLNYSWPGNVRELRNAVNRAVVLGEGKMIYPDDFDLPDLRDASLPPSRDGGFNEQKQKMIADFEREFISKILDETRGNISEAARRSGMYKKNLIDKMKQYGIKRGDFVRRAEG
jgi:transcriptional regulator with GAF, ATPase, and Fis domain